eukprot:Rhum_TRINITY_DN14077_c2_g3::Rhum_TRINITY_DN14077_c2_g3_i1::g.68588::m.68588
MASRPFFLLPSRFEKTQQLQHAPRHTHTHTYARAHAQRSSPTHLHLCFANCVFRSCLKLTTTPPPQQAVRGLTQLQTHVARRYFGVPLPSSPPSQPGLKNCSLFASTSSSQPLNDRVYPRGAVRGHARAAMDAEAKEDEELQMALALSLLEASGSPPECEDDASSDVSSDVDDSIVLLPADVLCTHPVLVQTAVYMGMVSVSHGDLEGLDAAREWWAANAKRCFLPDGSFMPYDEFAPLPQPPPLCNYVREVAYEPLAGKGKELLSYALTCFSAPYCPSCRQQASRKRHVCPTCNTTVPAVDA